MIKKLKYKVYLLLKDGGYQSRANIVVEYIIAAMITLNVVLIVLESIKPIVNQYSFAISFFRMFFFVFFLMEYLLRIWIADIVLHDEQHPFLARIRYMRSFRGIIDFLALIPVISGYNVIDFRVLRLFRITRIKWLNRYNDIFKRVIDAKGKQLLFSFFIVLVFIFASAVIIYDFENAAQPEVFDNIFTSLWWAASTVTTVGYGDVFPITSVGRALGAGVSLLGILVMAVPVGILSAGFSEVSKTMDDSAQKDKKNDK